MKRILITGGAGFIGSHLADELLRHGYQVRVLDILEPQVHGSDCRRPEYLANDVELVRGDICDAETVQRSLDGVDAVFHFASLVGVGQSMYQMARYTSVNNLGTAVLLDALRERPVERLLVASSMSIYGEGLYVDADDRDVSPRPRSIEQMRRGEWELMDEKGRPLKPVPTPESKPADVASIYALSKLDQERMCLIFGDTYGIDSVALRFFNCYGPRQALSNPYTGVLAIFASRCLNGKPPLIFEDGQQTREAVHVGDVAKACRLALESPRAPQEVFNIGSGQPVSVYDMAKAVCEIFSIDGLEPQVTEEYRAGDIRHCFSDISRARKILGYEPSISLEEGLLDLADWLSGHSDVTCSDEARQELISRGLVGGNDATPAHRPQNEIQKRNGHANKSSEKYVLITGGAGFVGTNVAAAHLDAGRRVLIFDNLSRPGVEKNLRWLQKTYGNRVAVEICDVRNADALRTAVADAPAVYHFAAQVAVTTSLVDPAHDFAVNAQGTLNVLEACRHRHTPPPLLFTSTNKVYGNLEDVLLARSGNAYVPQMSHIAEHGIDERRPLDLHSPYGCSKGVADQYVLDYARCYRMPNVVFRMSCIYGPHQCGTEDQGWIAHFVRRIIDGQPITLYGDGCQVRDILYVDDLARAMIDSITSIDRTAGHVFNVGGGPRNAVSLLNVLESIASIHGHEPELNFDEWRQGDQRYFVSDTRAIESAIGWRPDISTSDGVESLYRWMAAEWTHSGKSPVVQV